MPFSTAPTGAGLKSFALLTWTVLLEAVPQHSCLMCLYVKVTCDPEGGDKGEVKEGTVRYEM